MQKHRTSKQGRRGTMSQPPVAIVRARARTITVETVYVPPPKKMLNCEVDAGLKMDLEDAARAHCRAGTEYGTQAKIVEAALAMWLDAFRQPQIVTRNARSA